MDIGQLNLVPLYLDYLQFDYTLAHLSFVFTSRVMKKGRKSEDRSNFEAKEPTILTPKAVIQHPARGHNVLWPELSRGT
jgi:hypothetical protein